MQGLHGGACVALALTLAIAPGAPAWGQAGARLGMSRWHPHELALEIPLTGPLPAAPLNQLGAQRWFVDLRPAQWASGGSTWRLAGRGPVSALVMANRPDGSARLAFTLAEGHRPLVVLEEARALVRVRFVSLRPMARPRPLASALGPAMPLASPGRAASPSPVAAPSTPRPTSFPSLPPLEPSPLASLRATTLPRPSLRPSPPVASFKPQPAPLGPSPSPLASPQAPPPSPGRPSWWGPGPAWPSLQPLPSLQPPPPSLAPPSSTPLPPPSVGPVRPSLAPPLPSPALGAPGPDARPGASPSASPSPKALPSLRPHPRASQGPSARPSPRATPRPPRPTARPRAWRLATPPPWAPRPTLPRPRYLPWPAPGSTPLAWPSPTSVLPARQGAVVEELSSPPVALPSPPLAAPDLRALLAASPPSPSPSPSPNLVPPILPRVIQVPPTPPPKATRLGHPYFDMGRSVLVWPVLDGQAPEVHLGVDQGRAVAWLSASRWAQRATLRQALSHQGPLLGWEASSHPDGARLRLQLGAPADLLPGFDHQRREWLLAVRPKVSPPPLEATPSGEGPPLVAVGGNPEGPLRLHFSGPPPTPLVQRLGPEDSAVWWLGARLGPEAPRMGRSPGPGLPAWWALAPRPEGVLLWVRHPSSAQVEARAFPSLGAAELSLQFQSPALPQVWPEGLASSSLEPSL